VCDADGKSEKAGRNRQRDEGKEREREEGDLEMGKMRQTCC